MPAYRDKDCPDCGRLAAMTADRCPCGYEFPPPATWSPPDYIESRIYDQAELVLVLSDLDRAARPIQLRTSHAARRRSVTDLASTQAAKPQKATVLRMAPYPLIAAMVIAGFACNVPLAFVVAAVLGVLLFLRRATKRGSARIEGRPADR